MPPRPVSLLLIAVLLGGCAASRPAGSPPMSPDAANGQAIVSVVGTPFHALFKATACLVSAVVAVPSAAALALTDRQDRVDEQAALYAGLGRNCYGSYALEPI